MEKRLDFYFDLSCPYAYLGSTRVEALAERTGAELRVLPFLLGGVFRALGRGQNMAAGQSPTKARHGLEDIDRFARRWQVPLRFPAGHPIRTVTSLRALLVVEDEGGELMPLVHRLYRAYWVEGRDLADEAVVRAVLDEAGLDGSHVVTRTQELEIKERLRTRTDEALGAGVFGAPAFVVHGTGSREEGQVIWGQDRMDRVERALGGSPPPELPESGDGARAPVDLWIDYSSPYSAIAAARAAEALGDAVRFRFMLLGGVFHTIGAPNVPFLALSEPKRRWNSRDLAAQARDAGMAFRWPSRFPMRTILPLRVTLQVGANSPEGRRLARAIFEAYWCEDRDISDPAEVMAISDAVGLDGAALVEGAGDPAIKAMLRQATEDAVAAGVFGAPTWIVDPGGEAPELFWGNDRLSLVAEAGRRP